MELSLNPWEVLGVDVNASTNFFTLSDGHKIGLSRPLANKVNRFKKDFAGMDEYANNQKKKKYERRKGKVEKNAEYHLDRKIEELVKYANQHGFSHIVAEDTHGLDPDLNGDLSGWIGLGEVKTKLSEISEIPVSLVHAQFTSQTCPRCSFIHPDNRATRDKFHCKRCGYHGDADKIAARNIRDRITEPLLRERLEYFDGERYLPKENICTQDFFDVYGELHVKRTKEYKKKKKEMQWKQETETAAKAKKARRCWTVWNTRRRYWKFSS